MISRVARRTAGLFVQLVAGAALAIPAWAQSNKQIRVVPVYAAVNSFAARYASAETSIADSAFHVQVLRSHQGPCRIRESPDWFARPSRVPLHELARRAEVLEHGRADRLIRQAARAGGGEGAGGALIYCVILARDDLPAKAVDGVLAIYFPSHRQVMIFVRPVGNAWRDRLWRVIAEERFLSDPAG